MTSKNFDPRISRVMRTKIENEKQGGTVKAQGRKLSHKELQKRLVQKEEELKQWTAAGMRLAVQLYILNPEHEFFLPETRFFNDATLKLIIQSGENIREQARKKEEEK